MKRWPYRIAMILLIGCVSAFGVTVSIPNTSVNPGTATVQIPVNIDDATGVAGFQFKINFDNTVLNATGAIAGSLTTGWTVIPNTGTPGQIQVGGFSATPITGGSGSLCILQFNVVGTPASTTNITFTSDGHKLTDFQAVQIPNTAQNGTFHINGYNISGTVTLVGGSGQVTQVQLTLEPAVEKVTTNPNAQGVYTFSDLAPGTYTITPQLTGYVFTPATRTVTVTNANVTGQNFTGDALASVSGTVSYAGTQTGTIYVGLFTSSDFTQPPAYWTSNQTKSATFNYQIQNVAPGQYWAASFMDVNADGQWQQGTEPSGTYSGNPFTLTSGQNKTGVNITLKEPLTLDVASAHGSPVPSIGQHVYYTGDVVNASVSSPVAGPAGTRYVCIGWTGTGSVLATGTTTSTQFTMTQNSTITWNWKTQYQLTYSANPSNGGTVTVNPVATGNWYDENTPVQLTATPNTNYVFLHWILDGEIVEDDKNGNATFNITMDQPHDVVAVFALNQPVLNVTPANVQFYFNVNVDDTTKETEIVIKNTGSGPGTLDWQINPANIVYQQGTGWIDIFKQPVKVNGIIGGSLFAQEQETIILQVNRTGKTPGEYNATIPVTSNGGNANISVKMIVNQPPTAQALHPADDVIVETAVEFNAKFTSNGGTIVKSVWNIYDLTNNKGVLPPPLKTIELTGSGNRIILPLAMFMTSSEVKQGGMYAWSVQCWDSYGEPSAPDLKTFTPLPANEPSFIGPQGSAQIILPDGATEETALVRNVGQGLVRITPLRVASFPGANSVFANLFDIRVEGIGTGDTALIEFEVPGSISGWYKYQYNNETQTWEVKTMSADDTQDEYAKTGVADTPGYTKITLQLKDGGQYDADGQENGVIADPSGAGVTQGMKVSGGGGGCFIATAAFGSYQERHVWILRQFRDRYLLTNPVGRAFVKWYYKHSPKYASIIAQNNSLRTLARIILMPVYVLALISLKFRILALAVLAGILIVLTQKGVKWLRKEF
ncbi:MAG: cohesin domain-containing protein [Candidatus Omnitrophica bacterium]|nr:cohesin domain-containing protein [Candidatus Omnitrophota bacterium]